MFNKRKLTKAKIKALIASRVLRQAHDKPLTPVAFEPLEGRRLLSGGPFGFEGGFGGGGFGPGFGGEHQHNAVGQTITFGEAPTAVQRGLDTLATTDGVAAPASTTTVYLGNSNGIESYTIDITGTGTQTRLTVDQGGNPVTAPTQSSTTFGAITNTSVTAEITAIASALSLTAPTSTTVVNVSTASDGTATYTVALASSSASTTTSYDHDTIISVDSNGDLVGNERVPLSTLSSAIQSGLTSNAPSGATALTSNSLIEVRTIDGVTTYTADYTSSGTTSTVSVNSSGTLTSLPSAITADFSTIPTAAQTELQTLATADGVATVITSTQTVTEYAESNGTTIYSVTLDATSPTGSTTSSTYTITLSVDASGNPTVPPDNFGGRFDGGFGGGGGCEGMGSATAAGTTSTTGTTTTTGTTSTTGTTTSSTASTTSTSAVVAAQVLHPSTATSSSTSTTASTTSTGTTTTTTKAAKHHHAARHKQRKA